MSEIVLNAEIRTSTKKHAKHTRWNGMVPGVYYARGEENVNIQVPALLLNQLVFTSVTHVIDLQLQDGTAHKAILKDVQWDPVTDRPVHFDLQGLKENERLTIEIPIVLTGGIPKGVRDGGMLQHFVHKLKVSCLPKDIPEKIEINVGEMSINDFVHVSSVDLPNVTIIESEDTAIVGIMPPNVVKETVEEAPVEGVVAVEPEVVGKGKKGEEGAEGAEAPAKPEKSAKSEKSAKPEKSEK